MDLGNGSLVDHGTHKEFFEYYAKESLTPEAIARFRSVKDAVLRFGRAKGGLSREGPHDVLDVGCGAGTQSILWAKEGHRVRGLDVNGPLLDLAKQRARDEGVEIDFRLGTATELPWSDESVDVCLAAELLEHVEDWKACLAEFSRVLRDGGVLFFSTTNRLCPVQQEFSLPFYSWYPSFIKKRYVRLAKTTRPSIVNYAKYPAVNWFTYYGLRRFLFGYAVVCYDRFDNALLGCTSPLRRRILKAVCSVPILRFIGHVCTPYTAIFGVKQTGAGQGVAVPG